MVSIGAVLVLWLIRSRPQHAYVNFVLTAGNELERREIRSLAGSGWVAGSEYGSVDNLMREAPKHGARVRFIGPNLYGQVVTPELGPHDTISDVSYSYSKHRIAVVVKIGHSAETVAKPGCRYFNFVVVVDAGTYRLTTRFIDAMPKGARPMSDSRIVTIRYEGE